MIINDDKSPTSIQIAGRQDNKWKGLRFSSSIKDVRLGGRLHGHLIELVLFEWNNDNLAVNIALRGPLHDTQYKFISDTNFAFRNRSISIR